MSSAPTPSIPIEELLEHRAWVRTLALSLTTSASDADDLEQQAWLTAIERPPRHSRSLRGWLASVVRTSAAGTARSSGRRTLREDVYASARGKRAESAVDLAARAELHGRVVASVVALAEPYRETVLLRFFEGLPLKEVAARTGAPLETTRARLRRAKERLRSDLAPVAEEHGSLRRALVPLLLVPTSVSKRSALAAGGVIVSTKMVLSAVAVAALAVAAWWWTSGPEEPVVPEPEVAVAPIDDSSDVVPAGDERDRVGGADEVVESPRDSMDEPQRDRIAPPPKPSRTIAERLTDPYPPVEWRDTPLLDVCAQMTLRTGISIVVDERLRERITGDEGVINLRLDSEVNANAILDLITAFNGLRHLTELDRVVILAQDAEWKPANPVIVPEPWGEEGATTLVVRGVVRDTYGKPAAGATLAHRRTHAMPVGESGSDGTFEVEVEPPLGRLVASLTGHVASLELPIRGKPGDEVEIDLALRGPAASLSIDVTVPDDVDRTDVRVTVMWDHNTMREIEQEDGSRAIDRARDQRTLPKSGALVIDGIPPSMVKLYVVAPGCLRVVEEVPVRAGIQVEFPVVLELGSDIYQALDKKRVTMDFSGENLDAVKTYLTNTSKVNIVIDPEVAPELENVPITLRMEDVSLREALSTLCRIAGGLGYEERDGVVFVTRRANLTKDD